MTSLFTEDFEGGSNGATLTTGNTSFSAFNGSVTFTNTASAVASGSLAMQVTAASGTDVSANKTYASSQAKLWRRVYVTPPSTLTGTIDLIVARGSNALRARLRLNTNRTVSLMNGNSVVWTSTTVLPAGQVSRLAWRLDNPAGQQQLRLYVGVNPHTTTVTEDSANRTYNQGTIDTLRLGQINSGTTASTTVYFDAVADDDTNEPGPAVTGAPTLTASLTGSGTLTAALTSLNNTATVSLSGTGTLTVQIEAVPVPTPPPSHIHRWAAWTRDDDYAPSKSLLIDTANVLRKHVGVDTAVVTTPYDPETWDACAPSTGVLVYRDGLEEFSGPIVTRQVNWDAETDPRPLITLECQGDGLHLADRPVFPDRSRAADDQTVNDYWTFTGVASTAMWQLISDQAGPTCRADRQVSGLVMGADPGVGISRTWQQLFTGAGPNGVMDALAVISAASGEDLGVRVTSSAGQLLVDVVQPRDQTDAAKFSADMRNLVGFFYRETAPTVTHALSAGAGTLHARLRKLVVTTSALALSWGRQIWSYVDRSDTSDTTELTQAAQDAIDQGPPTVSLTCTLADTQAAAYRKDYDLGDKVTVYVGLPGQRAAAAVVDVIRQISLSLDNTGKEVIRPAIGSYDAKAIRPTPTQQHLAAVAARVSGINSRK